MTEIILQAYHVLDEIRKDQKYIEIKYLDQKMLELYDLEINLFQQTKLAFDKVMQEGGVYHPDYKDVSKKYIEAKQDLYTKPLVKRYFEVEKEFQTELNDFLYDLSHAVSNHIKTPDKLGIVKKGGSCHVR
jgi:cell fate (sporulation/competence/biofilm development) regulator YlbF (YheA/YmcA/DUF963 family)